MVSLLIGLISLKNIKTITAYLLIELHDDGRNVELSFSFLFVMNCKYSYNMKVKQVWNLQFYRIYVLLILKSISFLQNDPMKLLSQANLKFYPSQSTLFIDSQ